jgi:L-Lysine epsilon oxidase N-terminal
MTPPWHTVGIFPPIGIARVGNSELENGWFYGPEVPGNFKEPVGGFKDANGAVKRQVNHSILSVMLYDLSVRFIFFFIRPLDSEFMPLARTAKFLMKSTGQQDMTLLGEFDS